MGTFTTYLHHKGESMDGNKRRGFLARLRDRLRGHKGAMDLNDPARRSPSGIQSSSGFGDAVHLPPERRRK